MKITPIEHGLEDLIGVSPPGRTPGLHMSDLYGDLYKHLEPERYGRGGAPDAVVLEAGLACESILEQGLRDRLCGGGRPGELLHTEAGLAQPILFSPDLVIFNSHTRVGEIKLTWMSSREMPSEPSNNLPPKFSKYACQMMCYGHCLETPYARLLAYFINGDYGWMRKGGKRGNGPSPQLKAWDLEFSARELAENWSMIVNHGRSMGVL